MLLPTVLQQILNRSTLAALFTTLTLTGCYVEVSHEHEAHIDTEVHYTGNLTDFSTEFLLESALIPFALASESTYMLADPDAYTTPRVRTLSRAVITETSYAYLLDDWDCDYGGYNQTEAEAETVSYDDGYTWVDLWMNAEAFNCVVRRDGNYHTVNSNLTYQVTGWYDDWLAKTSEMDADLTGSVSVEYSFYTIDHNRINIHSEALSADDTSMRGTTSLWLDDGFDSHSASLSTERPVHWFVGDGFPHQGIIRIQSGYDWVEFEFELDGMWRRDSQNDSRYRSWNEFTYGTDLR